MTLALVGLPTSSAVAQCTQGVWKQPFDDTNATNNPQTPSCANPSGPLVDWPNPPIFQAIHLSLIPKGAHQGRVMAWDAIRYVGSPNVSPPPAQTRVIRYLILDPATKQVWKHVICLPEGMGDLFCAGHAWTSRGNLLIVGGTGCHGGTAGCPAEYEGCKLVYVWEPPTVTEGPNHGGTWRRNQTDLDTARWYPSVIALDTQPTPFNEDWFMVAGGTHLNQAVNSYQIWRDTTVPGGEWQQNPNTQTNTFNGPGTSGYQLGNYPRMHWLSTRFVSTAGGFQGTTRRQPHDLLGIWGPFWQMAYSRFHGTSVLMPIGPGGSVKDWVMVIGGNNGLGTILDAVEVCQSAVASPQWLVDASLMYRRWVFDAVLLPDSTVGVFGGEQHYHGVGCSNTPALVPEIYIGGGWSQMAPASRIRDYHSTHLLLHTAEVLAAAGESRRHEPALGNCPTRGPLVAGEADYEIFVPGYIHCGNQRPVIRQQATPGESWSWTRGLLYDVDYDFLPLGVSITKAVLIRAGSVTHHGDPNQRCVELEFSHNMPTDVSASIKVTVPARGSNLLPRGYYMLFLLSSQSTPSVAAWVKIGG